MRNPNIRFIHRNKAARCCWVCAIMLLCVFGLSACKDSNQEPPMTEPVQQTASITIETVYGPLRFPEELAGNIRHMEVTEGDIAMEVFYMLMADGERELFRICYGDPNFGEVLGFLNTDAGEVSVTYAVCEYTKENFPDEESWKQYSSLMGGFSMLTNAISEDSRFSTSRAVAEVETVTVKLTYWTVPVPANVHYQEVTEGDLYRVDFYGTIDDEQIKLYTIYLGEPHVETVLGTYLVAGAEKIVSVESTDMVETVNLTQEDYKKIESVNDVIQVIVSDKNFSAE